MKKSLRQEVYNKYEGRCAYCGKVIEYKDMQVDHVVPLRRYGDNNLDNLYPSCRSCNHYKRAHSLEDFRRLIETLHHRVEDQYLCRVAESFGVISIKPWGRKFYFETLERYRQEENKQKTKVGIP